MCTELPARLPVVSPPTEYDRVPGGPQCECIEKMPVVSRADCTTYSSQGLVACENNDLRTHYDGVMQSPRGNLIDNLVGNCHNE